MLLKKLLVLISVFSLYGITLNAQCDRPFPSDNACTAPYFCNTAQLNAYCSTIKIPVFGKSYLVPRGFCGTLESPSWYRFKAQTATLSLQFAATNCGTDGVQALILSSTNCNDSASFTTVSNCINANGGQPTATVTATGLIAGQTYYILVDGYSGAGCNFKISVLAGTIQDSNDPIPQPSDIFGPHTLCIGATSATFSVPKYMGVTDYVFSVAYNGGAATTFTRPDSFYTIASIPPTATVVTVCVNYKNDCASGPVKCIDVPVAAISTVLAPTIYLCPGDTHTFPDGQTADNTTPPNNDGTLNYSYTVKGKAGACDTNFNVNVVSYANRRAIKTYFLKPGTGITIGNNLVFQNTDCAAKPGTQSLTHSAINGCDSTVTYTIYNAKQTYTLSASTVNITCGTSKSVSVTASDTCNGVVHLKTYSWLFQPDSVTARVTVNGANTNTLALSQTGIYSVVIRDSVFLKLQQALGYAIFSDTLKVTVTGTGVTPVPVQPVLINGVSSQNICQGGATRFTINKVANATNYTWTTQKGGKITEIVTGPNDTSVVITWANNVTNDTVSVTPSNSCSLGTAQTISITFINFANLNAGKDSLVCDSVVKLYGTASTLAAGGKGSWSNLFSNARFANFTDATNVNTTINVPASGIYNLIWMEQYSGCTRSDTVAITFYSPPKISGVTDSCSFDRSKLYVRFVFTQGNPPFTIKDNNSGTTNTFNQLGQFQSNAIKPGNYQFSVTDTKSCVAPLISGLQSCNTCNNKTGNMNLTPISVCAYDTARANYLGGFVNSGKDTLEFVLYKKTPQSGIIARSYTPKFAFQPGMLYDSTYYIAAISGLDSSNHVAVNDLCFSPSAGVPVVFHKKPTVAILTQDTLLCAGTCAKLTYTFSGATPYTLRIRLTDSVSRDSLLVNIRNADIASFCPGANTTLRLKTVADSLGCQDTSLTQVINFKVFPVTKAGTALPDLSICGSLDTTLALITRLQNAAVGGVWKESSAVKSNGNAFVAAAGTFNPKGQTPSTYSFQYIKSPAAGSNCTPDTATINIKISQTLVADAGKSDTIRCNHRMINIGGSRTTTGDSILISWSGNGLSGNSSVQTVNQAGTYTLKVSSGACVALDSVIIYIDTTAPRSAIKPLANPLLTCVIDSVILDGSASSPRGQIQYLWTYNGAPFDFQPVSKAQSGGSYQLKVTRLSNGCTGLDTIYIPQSRTKPTVIIQNHGNLTCRDSILKLDATSSSSGINYILKWTASRGGLFASDSTTLLPSVKRGGDYTLVITDTSNKCVDSLLTTVKTDTLIPYATAFASDTLNCRNATVSVSARGSSLGIGLTYQWIARPGHIVTGDNTLNATVDEPGTYYFVAANNTTGCAAVDTVTVFQSTRQPNALTILTKQPSCYGDCDAAFKIDTVVGGTSPYLYSLDTKVFTGKNVFSNLCAGSYHLSVQDANGCKKDTTFSINQNRQLSASLGQDTTLLLGDSILLHVYTNADSVVSTKWSSYTDSVCAKALVCYEQWVKPITLTSYSVHIVDKNNCFTDGTINIKIDKKRPVYVPSAFSPNNDSNNDVFYIYSTQVVQLVKEFTIYDRWGEAMFGQQNFKTDDPTFGWDGNFKGKEAPSGVYLYYITVQYQDGTTEVISGNVTLLR